MAHAALVDVLNSGNQLKVKLARLLLREPCMSHNVVEQLAPIAILHDHVELFFSFNYFVKLNHIWVSDLLENFDFSCDSLHVFLIIDFVFLEDFDGYFLAGQRVLAELDLSEGSLAKMLAWICEKIYELINIKLIDKIDLNEEDKNRQ